MVLVITGTAESNRNTMSRLLANDLGWKFVDAGNLDLSANLDARDRDGRPDPALRIQTLSAAVNSWIFEWQDVVVSCPVLTETDRRQLCAMSSLVKIVCLAACRAPGCTSFLDGSVRGISSEHLDEWHVPEPSQEVLTVDSSGQVEEIITEVVSAVVLNRQSQYAETAAASVHEGGLR